MPEYGESYENLEEFRRWQARLHQNLIKNWQLFPQEAAKAAEAREQGEVPQSELFSPKSLLSLLKGAEDDPASFVRAFDAAYRAALETIVEILRSHWQEAHPTPPESRKTS